MAPGILTTDNSSAPQPPGETITFHAGKGKGTGVRHFVPGGKPTLTSIPTVDFNLATSPHLSERQSVAAAVGGAFTETGFMYAVSHGIPPSQLSNAPQQAVRDFFALPAADKMAIHINNSPAIRGYEAGAAFKCADDPWEPEQRAPRQTSTPPSRTTYPPNAVGKPPNQWPDAVSAFARAVLRMVALALNQDEAYFYHMRRFPMAAGLRALRVSARGT
ncbi:hypothetical protein IWZ03DRAFT_412045 [Phyllosticta citriasiana]|uniref:Non-haem dioxygenase N-terminal domain-containing protein n=1 Tax=Phyllosticta citriasiana TaxID=595635 RepID=A0ABR1KUK4_9PEZI